MSVLRVPAASVPAGFTPDGLPVGLQVVGRPGDDLGVLALSHALEQVFRAGDRRPDIAARAERAGAGAGAGAGTVLTATG